MTKTISIKKYIRLGLLGGLFAFIVAYSILKMLPIFRGVELSISGIKNGETVKENLLSLTGTALHAKHLKINDREILIDEKNNFSEEVYLSPGYNIVTVDAEDRFEKKKNKTYEIIYDPPDVENLVGVNNKEDLTKNNN